MEKMNKVKKREKKICLDETMANKPSTYKYIPKYISGTTLERQRRNTHLTKNIVMAAPVTMNSTLDNAGVLDPLLKFIFKK